MAAIRLLSAVFGVVAGTTGFRGNDQAQDPAIASVMMDTEPDAKHLSIYDILRKYPRESLLVQPLYWTPRQLFLLQGQFVDQSQQDGTDPNCNHVGREEDEDTSRNIKGLVFGQFGPIRLLAPLEQEKAMSFLLEYSRLGHTTYSDELTFSFDHSRGRIPCVVFGRSRRRCIRRLVDTLQETEENPKPWRVKFFSSKPRPFPVVAWVDRVAHIADKRAAVYPPPFPQPNPPVAALRRRYIARATPADPREDPYIAAVLIALAQAQRAWSRNVGLCPHGSLCKWRQRKKQSKRSKAAARREPKAEKTDVAESKPNTTVDDDEIDDYDDDNDNGRSNINCCCYCGSGAWTARVLMSDPQDTENMQLYTAKLSSVFLNRIKKPRRSGRWVPMGDITREAVPYHPEATLRHRLMEKLVDECQVCGKWPSEKRPRPEGKEENEGDDGNAMLDWASQGSSRKRQRCQATSVLALAEGEDPIKTSFPPAGEKPDAVTVTVRGVLERDIDEDEPFKFKTNQDTTESTGI